MKKINFTDTFIYRDYIINYNRIKSDVYGNPRYQYSIVNLTDLFNSKRSYSHQLYIKQSYNIEQDLKEIIDMGINARKNYVSINNN